MSRHQDPDELDFILGLNDSYKKTFCLEVYTEIHRLYYCCDQYNKYWPELISKIQGARITLTAINKELSKDPAWKQTTPKERIESTQAADRINHHITDKQTALASLMCIVNQSIQNLIDMTTCGDLTTKLTINFAEIDRSIPTQPHLRKLTDQG